MTHESDEGQDTFDAPDAWSLRQIEGVASWGGARALALAAAWRSSLVDPVWWVGGQSTEPLSRDPQVLAWQREAARLATDDPVANILLLRAGGEVQLEAAQRWAEAEPANLAPRRWLDLSAQTLPELVRGCSRYDLHCLQIRRLLLRARREFPPTVAEYEQMFGHCHGMRLEWLPIISSQTSWLLPGESWPVALRAWADDLGGPAGIALCRRISQVLQASDSPVVVSLGLEMAARLPDQLPGAGRELDDSREAGQRADAFFKAKPELCFPLYGELLDDQSIRTEVELSEALDQRIRQHAAE